MWAERSEQMWALHWAERSGRRRVACSAHSRAGSKVKMLAVCWVVRWAWPTAAVMAGWWGDQQAGHSAVTLAHPEAGTKADLKAVCWAAT